jgi:hypothetical protein
MPSFHRRKKTSKAGGAKKATPAKGGRKGKKAQSEEDGEIGSDDDKEFDDGLDEDFIGEKHRNWKCLLFFLGGGVALLPRSRPP